MTDKTSKHARGEARREQKPLGGGVDPLIIAGGAVVVGAAVGALLPRSDAEKRALAPVGVLVSQATTRALQSAREAVSSEVSSLPVVGPAAAAQLDQVIDAVVPSTPGSDAG